MNILKAISFEISYLMENNNRKLANAFIVIATYPLIRVGLNVIAAITKDDPFSFLWFVIASALLVIALTLYFPPFFLKRTLFSLSTIILTGSFSVYRFARLKLFYAMPEFLKSKLNCNIPDIYKIQHPLWTSELTFGSHIVETMHKPNLESMLLKNQRCILLYSPYAKPFFTWIDLLYLRALKNIRSSGVLVHVLINPFLYFKNTAVDCEDGRSLQFMKRIIRRYVGYDVKVLTPKDVISTVGDEFSCIISQKIIETQKIIKQTNLRRMPGAIFLTTYMDYLLHDTKNSLIVLRWEKNIEILEKYNSNERVNILIFRSIPLLSERGETDRSHALCLDDSNPQLSAKLVNIYERKNSEIKMLANILRGDEGDKGYEKVILDNYPASQAFKRDILDKDALVLSKSQLAKHLGDIDSASVQDKNLIAYTWVRIYFWKYANLLGIYNER